MNVPDHLLTNTRNEADRTTHVWWVIGSTVLLSLLLRLPSLDVSLWIDETGSIAQATAADFWATARQDVHPPLYSILLRGALEFTASVPLLRLFSVACGTALAALAAYSMRRSLPAAIIAGFGGAALPELVHHSEQLRPYALLFLLLGIALALSARVATGHDGVRTSISLGLVLFVAAATHLVTGFYLLALVPLLWWPSRHHPVRAWLTPLLPLLPAGLLLLWFKFAFVIQPKDIADGWWIPAPSVSAISNSLSEVAGWNDIQWLADAAERRLAAASWGVPLLALTSLAVAFATAWGHRQARPLNILLPVSGLIYGLTLVGY